MLKEGSRAIDSLDHFLYAPCFDEDEHTPGWRARERDIRCRFCRCRLNQSVSRAEVCLMSRCLRRAVALGMPLPIVRKWR